MRSLTEEKERTCNVRTAAERGERESRGVKEVAAKAGRDIPSTSLNPSSSQHVLQPDTFAHLFVQVLYHS